MPERGIVLTLTRKPHSFELTTININSRSISIKENHMRQLVFLMPLILIVSGCMPAQKPIEWSAIGGSRSDATVKLAYSYKYGTPTKS
jgi:hypothetical protein